MKIIMCLTDKIEEELHDANSYIELAIKWRAEDKDVGDLFYTLSTEEMGHVDKIHNEVVDQIKVYREEHGEPPKGMMELYDHLHRKHTEKAMTIKIKQKMYLEE